jgi:hypothetical protein
LRSLSVQLTRLRCHHIVRVLELVVLRLKEVVSLILLLIELFLPLANSKGYDF